jgi:DNA-binding CsgD family transcriptional regulator
MSKHTSKHESSNSPGIERELRRDATRGRAAEDAARPRLTARELEVLSWLARGKSGGEISIILGISVPTVRIHIRSIFRKLEATNIPHAVARAFWIGIF